MPVMGTEGVREFWAKAKEFFGRKVGASTTATTVSIQLKNNAGTNLGDAATIGAATTTAAGVMSADDKSALNGAINKLSNIDENANNYSHPTTTATTAAAKKVGNDALGHVVLGDALTAADVGAAASSHTHGNITSAGDITTNSTIASGDRLVINDESASKITNSSITFGTGTTTFLRNDGTWGTPTDSDTHHTSFTVVGATATAKANAAATSNGSVYINHIENDAVRSSHNIVGSGTTTVTSDADGKITISSADSKNGTVTSVDTGAGLTGGAITNSGTIKANLVSETKLTNAASAGTETAGRVYPVALDKDGKLAVNVPWTDNNDDTKVTNTLATTTKAYITGTTSATTSTGTQVFDTGVYLDTTAGKLHATNFDGSGASLTNLNGSNISSGTVSASYLPTTAVNKGGTGATDAAGARTNLDVYSKSEVDSLITGGATFQSLVDENTTISNSSYRAGQYWVVSTAGTYVGQSCEVGDMIYAIANKGAAYSADDFSVVQNNLVEMTAAEVDAICI